MKKVVAAVALATTLVLAGCMTARSSTEYTCVSATAALKTAIQYNAALTPGQRATITAATKIVDPVCGQKEVPTLGSNEQALLVAAAGQLSAVAAAVTPGR